MRKKKISKLNRKINEILEIPAEVYGKEQKLTVIGFNKILIENYKGILEYTENYIKLSTHIGLINISGYSLELQQMTEDDIMINGKLDSIEFEENESKEV